MWTLGNLGPDEGGQRSFVIELSDFGLYPNTAALDYRVGLNEFTLPANVVETLYDDEPPGTDTGVDSTSADSTSADSTSADSTSADSTTSADSSGSASGSGEDGSGSGQGESAGNDEIGTSDVGVGETVDGCSCSSRAAPERSGLAWLFTLALGLGLRSRRSR